MTCDLRYRPLFEPIRIGPKILKNRLVQVPQCTGAGWRSPGASAAHREVKAEGGWAALCTEACSVHPEADQTVSTVQTLWDEGDVLNHRHMVDSVHRWGALAGVELFHAGGLSDNLGTRHVQAAVRQYQAPWMPVVYGLEADAEDLARVVAMHAEAARRALEAGFDIVYLHGTHGTLPVQALSRRLNRRTDRYGGGFADRARLFVELLEGMRRVVDGQAALACRFSVDQLAGPNGIEAGDEGLALVEHVTRLGLVDLWDLNVGGLEEWGEDAAPSRFQKINHQAPWTRGAKAAAGGVPVVGVGRFTDPDEMLRALRSGQCDVIGCARPSIADPWLPRKLAEGRAEDIRECIGCNQCVSRFERGGTIVCVQNPTALEEYRRGWHPERVPLSVAPEPIVVVGAGPAGLECALTLARRGHQVHLMEAAAELGGHLRDVVRLPGLAEWGRTVAWREGQLAKLANATVLRGLGEVAAEDLVEYGAARVVLATGAAPAFLTPEQVMAGKAVGRRVAVLDQDGYFMAASLAELLADRGHAVTLVTHYDKLAPYMDWTLEGPNLRRLLREKGVRGIVGHGLERVEAGATLRLFVHDVHRDGWRRTGEPMPGMPPRRRGTDALEFECDSLVLCTSRRSRTALWQALRALKPRWPEAGLRGVHRVGDCLAPRYLADAVFDGHRLAREIEAPDPERPLSIRRERPIWGQPSYPEPGQVVL
jgi:dimethylamine/trimethylamine dehydrogenase